MLPARPHAGRPNAKATLILHPCLNLHPLCRNACEGGNLPGNWLWPPKATVTPCQGSAAGWRASACSPVGSFGLQQGEGTCGLLAETTTPPNPPQSEPRAAVCQAGLETLQIQENVVLSRWPETACYTAVAKRHTLFQGPHAISTGQSVWVIHGPTLCLSLVVERTTAASWEPTALQRGGVSRPGPAMCRSRWAWPQSLAGAELPVSFPLDTCLQTLLPG